MNPTTTAPPEEEDSPDFSGAEVEQAVLTLSSADLATKVATELRQNPGSWLDQHQLRRWKKHLYWRVKLHLSPGEEKVLVYSADWLAQEKP